MSKELELATNKVVEILNGLDSIPAINLDSPTKAMFQIEIGGAINLVIAELEECEVDEAGVPVKPIHERIIDVIFSIQLNELSTIKRLNAWLNLISMDINKRNIINTQDII